MVEVVNRTSNTITVTINKETKLLASDVSKVWVISVKDKHVLYYKIESNDGRNSAQGEFVIKKDERRTLFFTSSGIAFQR